jgi:transposase
MRAVRDHGRPLVDDLTRLAGVATLGLDETSFLKATRTASTRYGTGLVDLQGGPLLEVVADRTRAAVHGWLDARPWGLAGPGRHGRAGPWRSSASPLVVPLGHATVAVDHFHAIRLANAAVDQGRRRMQQATLGIGARAGPLYRIRKLLLWPQSSSPAKDERGCGLGLPSVTRPARWRPPGRARSCCPPSTPRSPWRRPRAALERFYRWAHGIGMAELTRLARIVRAWEAEILAWHATGGCSNGPTEAMNLLIKKVKCVGHGFCNFANYRLRLLHCGVEWQTHRTARLRSRSPRLRA